MKKIFSLLIVFIISLTFIGCYAPNQTDGEASPPLSGNINEDYSDSQAPSDFTSPLFKLIASLNDTVGNKTVFRLYLSDGLGGYGYDIEFFKDKIEAILYIQSGESFTKIKNYEGKTREEIINAFILDFNDDENQDFLEKTRDVVFLTPSDLFNFDDETIKYVDTDNDKNGNTTYTPYVYENKVKTALPCLSGELANVSDVLNLKITVNEAESNTEISLNMTAKYVGLNGPTDVTLSVTHTKTA